MEPPLLPDVFHGEGQVVFVAEDGLVFRAVVLEGALDIGHHADGGHIAHKQGDADDALKDGPPPGDVRLHRPLQQVEQHGGQQEEQRHRQGHAQHRGHSHQGAGELFSQVVVQPLVHAGKLFLLVPLGELVGGEGQGLVAHAEGVNQGENAPDEGFAQDGVLFGQPGDGDLLGGDVAVFVAEGGDGALGAHHHNAFHQSLAADGGNFLAHT